MKKGSNIICPVCSREFYVSKGALEVRKYCSYACANKSYVKPNSKVTLVCEECCNPFEVYKSYLDKRRVRCCSKECDRKLRTKTQRKPNEERVNQKRIRKGAEWRIWREKVFKRDNYTCQHCGIRSEAGIKVELHPHHIKPYALFPESRFDISNGLTLCKECHYKEHKEGEVFKKYGDKKQFMEFLKQIHNERINI